MDITQLTGWLDYDRPHLPGLAPDERIAYFEKRVNLVGVRPLERILATEILVPDSSALLIYGVAICCIIEATGKFVTGGKGGNGERFEAFLHGYMDPAYHRECIGTHSYGALLWRHFRNGLAHGFSVRHGGFERNRGQAYFDVKQVAGVACLSVNPSALYDDFVQGFGRYLSELRVSQPVGQLFADFDSVFQKVFVLGE
jgi:hypothetical protein